MNETAVEQAAERVPNYAVDRDYANQLPFITFAKSILVLRNDQGGFIPLDGRQRAFKAFRTGHRLATARVVTVVEAFIFGLHPLTGELNLVRNSFRRTPYWDFIRDKLADVADGSQLEPVIAQLIEQAELNGRRALANDLRTLVEVDEEGHSPLLDYRLLACFIHRGAVEERTWPAWLWGREGSIGVGHRLWQWQYGCGVGGLGGVGCGGSAPPLRSAA